MPVDQIVPRDRSVAGADHRPGAEHRLHAAAEPEMVEIRPVAGALVERVADHAALGRPGGGGVHPLPAPPPEFVRQHLEAHPGLHGGEPHALVDLENPVHAPAEVEHRHARGGGRAGSEAHVVAGGGGEERHPVRVGEADQGGDLPGRAGIEHRRRPSVAARHGVLAIPGQRLVRRVDMFRAQLVLGCLQEGIHAHRFASPLDRQSTRIPDPRTGPAAGAAMSRAAPPDSGRSRDRRAPADPRRAAPPATVRRSPSRAAPPYAAAAGA